MKIVVGLGNPGRKYRHTPHNVGFEVIDVLAVKLGNVKLRESERFSAEIGKAIWKEEELLLVKPLTFMNQSGIAVAALMSYRQLAPLDLMVFVDDINLECGRIRIRARGSSGGHKGLDSVIKECGSLDFTRVRIGVKPEEEINDIVEYVLTPYKGVIADKIETGIKRAVDAFFVIIEKNLEEAMNRFNGLAVDGVGPEKEKKNPSK